MARRKLSHSFYGQPTLEVAPELIGKFLFRRKGRSVLVGRIVETEAYLAHPDRASHASRRNPARAAVMFGPPGVAYVYMIYGMYHCLNVVTEADGVAGAVLIRAVAPVEGLAAMERNRGRPLDVNRLADGPGKLCQAFAIDRRLNGTSLCRESCWGEDQGYTPRRICTGPRVGVEYAGRWARKPWRFWEADCPFMSRRPKQAGKQNRRR